MQTSFSLAQLADPEHRDRRQNPARLRALRLLPGDLPDLCAARRRARFAARAHLSHQGDAGARCAGDRGGRHAHRSLPLVPRLHDHVPVGRALHASGRSRPRAYRGNLHAAAARPADAAVSRPCDAVSAPASHGDDGGRDRQAVRAAARRARIEAARRRRPARAAARAGRHDRDRRPSGERRAQGAGGAARRLRQRGAGAVDHAGDDPPAQPPWRRGRGRAGGRLLRLARASHRPRGGRVRQGARQHRRLDPRDRRRGARRHPHHHLGLRHHGERLRLHAAHRSGLCGRRPPRSQA